MSPRHTCQLGRCPERSPRSGTRAPPSPRAAEPERDISPAKEHTAGWRLVAAAQAGDSEAFGKLYDSYVDVVFRYVLFRVDDRNLAEDVTSETFLRALRRISTISYRGRDVGAWFVTIARNLIFDHVKSSRYRLETASADPVDVAGGAAPTSAGPDDAVIADATTAELMRCVAELATDQRECIVLRFLQGLSVAETAAVMNRKEGAATPGGTQAGHPAPRRTALVRHSGEVDRFTTAPRNFPCPLIVGRYVAGDRTGGR